MRAARLHSILLLSVFACDKSAEPDAYGNLEATEVVVGAEASGQLVWFRPEEGMQLPLGATVGVIDTVSVSLEIRQVGAQRSAVQSRAREVEQQIDVLVVQRDIAARALARTRRLYEQQAATAPQLDQAEREYRVLDQQIEAARAQRETVLREAAAADARIGQARDRINNSRIVNPRAGTVLTSYREAGEFVAAGQPLYRIADLSKMIMRAYVTEAQLAQLRIGQAATVTVDVGAARQSFPGTVSWIAAEAEFTPTPIETREERTGLVYAVKIDVPNPNGVLKVGLPGDVRFNTQRVAGQ